MIELAAVEWETKDKMLFIGGSKTSYRCECGCNVFRAEVENPNHFKCNACGTTYSAERPEPIVPDNKGK